MFLKRLKLSRRKIFSSDKTQKFLYFKPFLHSISQPMTSIRHTPHDSDNRNCCTEDPFISCCSVYFFEHYFSYNFLKSFFSWTVKIWRNSNFFIKSDELTFSSSYPPFLRTSNFAYQKEWNSLYVSDYLHFYFLCSKHTHLTVLPFSQKILY